LAQNAPQYLGLIGGAAGELLLPGSGYGMYQAGTALGKGIQDWHNKKYNTSNPGSPVGKVTRKMAKVAHNNMLKTFNPDLYQRKMKRKRMVKAIKHSKIMAAKKHNRHQTAEERQAISSPYSVPHQYTR
jgi:hypothetical protein